MLRPSSTSKICQNFVSNVKTKKKVNCAVYGCGLSASGALAIPKLVASSANDEALVTAKEAKYPKRIPFFNTEKIRHISSGFGFSLFASSSKLYGAGINNLFQIGGQSTSAQEYYTSAKKIRIPLAEGEEILGISSGRAHSLILTTSGVYAIGDNCFGQCALDPQKCSTSIGSPENPLKPINLDSPHKIIKIHCSLDTSFLLDDAGQVWSFGLNEDGQCANEKYGIQWQPAKISGDAAAEKIVQVTGSTDTILALSESGKLFIWGQSEYHQAADSSLDIQRTTSRNICESLKIGKITSAASTSVSCVIGTEKGEVYTWGVGILGLGPKIERLEAPTLLDSPFFENLKVKKVFAGNSAMAAINEKGRMFVWGENRFASLGLGHQKRQLFPFAVVLPGDVKDIALGPDHSLFLIH